MRYPYGTCRTCGERLFSHVEGDYQCRNCERRFPTGELESPTA